MMYLGLDIGKRWHEAALVDADGAVMRQLRFAPTRAGLTSLTAWLGALAPADVQVGLEATGVYWLTERGVVRVVVLNARQARAFRNADLRGSKTDRTDAVALATLVRCMGAALPTHVRPDDRRAAARDVSRLRTETVELREPRAGGREAELPGHRAVGVEERRLVPPLADVEPEVHHDPTSRRLGARRGGPTPAQARGRSAHAGRSKPNSAGEPDARSAGQRSNTPSA